MSEPISGYRTLNKVETDLINLTKLVEANLMKHIDALGELPDTDKRLLAISRTQVELGFMAMVKSIARPSNG